jgi:hypothetical protein
MTYAICTVRTVRTALSVRVPHFSLPKIVEPLTFHERVTDQGHDSVVLILHAENSRKEFINKFEV